jgi:hypothetical protein
MYRSHTPMQITLVTVTFLFAASSAFARLGEEEAQIEQRYGKPTKIMNGQSATGAVNRAYSYDIFHVVVGFIDGVSHMESVMIKGGLKLDSEQISKLLAANAPSGTHWIKQSRSKWTRSDKGATAELSFDAAELTIASREMNRRVNKAVDEIEKNRMDRF